jgi:hypothetical protein
MPLCQRGNKYYFRSEVESRNADGTVKSYKEWIEIDKKETWIIQCLQHHSGYKIVERHTYNNNLKGWCPCCPFVVPFCGPFYHQWVVLKLQKGNHSKWLLLEKLGSGIYAQFDVHADRRGVLKDKDNHERTGMKELKGDKWPPISTDNPPKLQTFFNNWDPLASQAANYCVAFANCQHFSKAIWDMIDQSTEPGTIA